MDNDDINLGLIGLQNEGNTCYLNTAIQLLSHVPLLNKYFISNSYLEDIDNRYRENNDNINIILANNYAKLIKAFWSSKTTIRPLSMNKIIQEIDNRFASREQEDSQEVLSLIIDGLHEGLSYEPEVFSYSGTIENELDKLVVESIENIAKSLQKRSSIIFDLFIGQFINLISTSDGNIISKNFEMFNLLNIPIYGHTLYDSLSHYFSKEELESEFYYEAINKKIKAFKQIKLMRVPKYLIICLKRFNNSNGNSIKRNASITFPINDLDLSLYCEGYDKYICMYNLISVGCHSGNTLNFGHYYCISKHTDKKWYKFNDHNVSEFNIDLELNMLFKNGYILVYEKVDD